MEGITAALERSMQNCFLGAGNGEDVSGEVSVTEDCHGRHGSMELKSQISLPRDWDHCLDMETDEAICIDWRSGMRETGDHCRSAEWGGDWCCSEEEDNSASSHGCYSASSSRSSSSLNQGFTHQDQILVVAGCKSCLMYFMLPKFEEECPKCNGYLLHFDRPENDYF